MTYALKEGMHYYNLIEKEFKQNITPIPTTMNSLNPVETYGDNKGAIFMRRYLLFYMSFINSFKNN